MEKQITIKISIFYKHSIILKWFEDMLFFNPSEMKFTTETKNKFRAFKNDIFFTYLNKEISKDRFAVYCNNDNNNLWCVKNNESEETVILSAIIDKKLFDSNKSTIIAHIESLMKTDGIVARIHDSDDNFLNNTINIASYKSKGKSLEGVPIKKNMKMNGREFVDAEKLPGYEKLVGSIWFGASWKMWFSEPYYNYVSKNAIENFKDCYKSEKISDNCTSITLYENIDDYDNAENRQRQWSFKEAINFTSTVERLQLEERNKPGDPEIEIQQGEFEHGGVRLFSYYYDEQYNRTPKSKAAKKRIVEYDNDGKILWETELTM